MVERRREWEIERFFFTQREERRMKFCKDMLSRNQSMLTWRSGDGGIERWKEICQVQLKN